MQGDLRVVTDVPAAFAALVADLAPRTLAVSGGGTAERCYIQLAATAGIDWNGVQVLIGDERWVPVRHEDSNEGMVRRVLLDLVPATLHSVRDAGATPEEAADGYDRLLRGIGPLDVVHLGLGEDAHTASLFPGAPTLDVEDRFVVAAGDDAHPWPRVTFTFPAIAAARVVIVTVEGADKRTALAAVRRGDDVPGARIRGETVIWLVDEAAFTD